MQLSEFWDSVTEELPPLIDELQQLIESSRLRIADTSLSCPIVMCLTPPLSKETFANF